jgi:glycosyltransferase involved in cell wall biosynthesis
MSFAAKTVLIVTPDFPYPPNHGGRVDIWGRVKALHRLGFTIDLLATCKAAPSAGDMAAVRPYVREIIICARSRTVSDLLSFRPFQVSSRKALSSAALSGHYHLLLLESEFVAAVLSNPGLHRDVTVMRIHNREPEYFRQLAIAADNWREKIYFAIESNKFSLLERSLHQKVGNMMFISADEVAVYRKQHPKANCIFLPAPVDTASFIRKSAVSQTVLFIGSLFMVNNREAVSWFLHRVHPLLADIGEYKLIVAGNSRGTDLEWVRRLMTGNANIELIESPDDLEPLYRSGSVFVNPMQHGAGVKIKNIEAIQRGLPVVTTSIGNQGTGLVHRDEVLVADTPEGFAAAIRELLAEPERGQKLVASSQKKLTETYDHERILRNFLAPLLEIAAV